MSAENSAVAGFSTRQTYPVCVCVAQSSVYVPLSPLVHCWQGGTVHISYDLTV